MSKPATAKTFRKLLGLVKRLHARKRNPLTYAEIARRTGIGERTIRAYRSGDARPSAEFAAAAIGRLSRL